MSARRTVLVVNGPNLNLLGTRQPQLYGTETLADVEALVREKAAAHDLAVDFFQSNWEGAILDRLHEARGSAAGVIINPGGLSHVSVVLLDALLAVEIPVVEVHVTNIHRREDFRRHSYVSLAADAVIAGAGVAGYGFAVEYLASKLRAAAP